MIKSLHCVRILACALAASVALPVAAAYPDRPIRMVVISAPGGTTDIMSRLLAQAMGEGLGQQVVIDNRPGGGGLISAEIVSQSVPDGHTVLYTHTSFSVMPSLHKKLPYDSIKSFERVSLFALFPGVLLVNNSLPIKNVQELIAYAKARPGKVNYAAGTTGATAHLSGELLKSMAKIDIVHVPYKGTGGQLTSIVAGETQFTFASVPAALPFVKGGRARAIAVGSLKRSAALPDIPTVAESGLPGFDVSAWNGVMLPRGSSNAIVERLGREMQRVISLADMKERAAAQGAELTWTTPQEFTTYLNGQVAKWGKLVRESGLSNN
ncbi:MAG: tripartite tricarboxylate transporter substrate binding protein [Burkholderiales bacterium]|nr:tripartite tricarboxylate transporter substrate binding protein [Burkholderiales bacterium]